MNHREDIKYFNTKDIVPDCYIPDDRRFIYLITPVFNREHLGFICVEAQMLMHLNWNFESSGEQLIKGAFMLLEKDLEKN